MVILTGIKKKETIFKRQFPFFFNNKWFNTSHWYYNLITFVDVKLPFFLEDFNWYIPAGN